MATVEEYLANVGTAQRAEYERIRGIVRATVPDVEEGISYHMPVFKYRDKAVLWVGVFKNHMSLFPGTIKFTPDKPLPEETIVELVLKQVQG
jgi:uncharacterized protein YdhG (YjbR/CyaY superfamily)